MMLITQPDIENKYQTSQSYEKLQQTYLMLIIWTDMKK